MKAIEDTSILISGATDGLGLLVAERLAAQGATVIMHGRNEHKGLQAMADIKARTANHKLRYYNADLSSLQAVSTLAEQILSHETRLDVLVNNAGIGPLHPDAGRQLSVDGIEQFLAVNYLSAFLLSEKLLPLLTASAPARIINVTSIGQQEFDFADPQLSEEFDEARAYRQSKLAMIMHCFDLASLLDADKITVNCLHPATLMNTRMVSASDYFPGAKSSTEEGASALLRLIQDEALSTSSGLYFDGLKQATALAQAYDADARKQLRELSRQWLADHLPTP